MASDPLAGAASPSAMLRGGARPVEGAVLRPITSGDLVAMYNKHAETIAESA